MIVPSIYPSNPQPTASSTNRSGFVQSAGVWTALVIGAGSLVLTSSATSISRMPEGTGWWPATERIGPPSTPTVQPSTAARIAELKDVSGLTWGQLAALFGVTRRAVHHWARGSNMTAGHIERLEELHTRLSRGAFSADRNAKFWLFQPNGQASSRYSAWVAELESDDVAVRRGNLPQQVETSKPAAYIAQDLSGIRRQRKRGVV